MHQWWQLLMYLMMICLFNMGNKVYTDTLSLYDKFDLDNLFLIINRSNLNYYYEKYNCSNEIELEDNLWINYGVSIKII